MREEQNEELLRRRFQELAERSFRQDRPLFTGFLSPAEAQWALTAGKKAQVFTVLNGGYPDAERVIACFSSEDPVEEIPVALSLARLAEKVRSAKAVAQKPEGIDFYSYSRRKCRTL